MQARETYEMALIEGANAIANEELLDLNPELIEPFTQILQFTLTALIHCLKREESNPQVGLSM